ncbi:MAG: ABC transporter permease [Spirochaetales bacterium]|nr:ABC transporter permease [Spirochaetales bacterium]
MGRNRKLLLLVKKTPVSVGISLFILFIFLFCAIFASILTPYTPNEQNLKNIKAKPSQEHLLGTDHLGRDFLTRILHGARISLFSSVFSCTLGAIVGMFLGVVAGYSGKMLRAIIMRITDAMLSLPPLLLCMVLALVFGGGVLGVGFVIGIALMPTYIRVVYSMVLTLRKNDYVTEAKLLGVRKGMILVRHLLPNCFPTVIVVFTMNLGQAIMIEASLSYLGLGITAPTPAWGSMVSEGYKYIRTNPNLAILPGVCVLLIVVAFNLVGDQLRDVLDPRLRGKI